jgi:hypothetical protein
MRPCTTARRGMNSTQVLNLNAVITEYLNSPEMEKPRRVYANVEIVSTLSDDLMNVKGSPLHLKKGSNGPD